MNHFKVNNMVAFSVLCIVQASSLFNSKTFSSSRKKKHLIPLSSHSLFPTLQPLVNTNLLSVSIDLPILDISHNCNHIICDLLCHISWTLLLSIMFLSSIHVGAYTGTSCFLGMYTKQLKTGIHTKICPWIFKAALFTNGRNNPVVHQLMSG